MMNIRISPEAANDLEALYLYLSEKFGVSVAKKKLNDIVEDFSRLSEYPNIDTKVFERLDIVTDYKCFYTNNNYVFYRVNEDTISIIRVLDHRRDFMRVLFGVKMTEDHDD